MTTEPALALAADGPPKTRWLSAVLLTVSAVAIGYAIHIRDGEYTRNAIAWVGVAMLACLAAVVCPPLPESGWRRHAVTIALALGLAFQFLQMLLSPPGGWNYWSNDVLYGPGDRLRLYYVGVAGAAALVGLLAFPSRHLLSVIPLLVLSIHFLVGVWMIRAASNPDIDVYLFQQESSKALLRGDNPYALTFRDIYANRGDKPVYGPDVAQSGQLNFGFPYTPLSLYLAALGYLFAGDHRYAQLVAMTLSGALLVYARPGRVATMAGVLFLFTPRAFFILGRAWTEPFVVLGLALTVFFACRRSQSKWFERALPVALGLFLATKQYLVFVPFAAFLLLPRPLRWRSSLTFLAVAVAAAAAVTAPLALRDLSAFRYSAFEVQERAPFREDALSFLVSFWNLAGTGPDLKERLQSAGPVIASIAALVAAGVALWRAPRTPTGFAASLGLTYLAFIALNKQAFANYYFFVIGSLCAAVAAWAPNDEPAAPRPSLLAAGA